jgi:hypothetical protein
MQRINQEDILKLIQKKSWKPILKFLYEGKKEIKTDALLQYSATIFQSEFFQKIKQKNNNITFEDLQQLFLLHNGNFFLLQKDNYTTLVCELAIQSNGEASYNYATLFPEEKICAEIISEYSKNIKKREIIENKIEKMNWIEIYNRLFELINVQGDASTYFSGPRFIKTLKEFNPYHPDYTQYIGIRNDQGKSTSRRIYYYDIIMELDESIRIDFVNRMLEMVEPFEKEKVIPIKAIIKGENPKIKKPKKEVSNESVATVFISYSWDTPEHKKWVLDLANSLVKEGVNVLLDRYELRPGKSLTHFVETSIKKADRILIIFTPNYKLKAEKRAGGVGYEYSIMNSELYKNQTNNERIIPVLRNGNSDDSVPEFMQQYIHIDMTKDENYKNSYSDLLREIYDEPEIIKPKIGVKREIASS